MCHVNSWPRESALVAQETGRSPRRSLFAGDCLLCLASHDGAGICDHCERSLASLSPACPRCGLGLPVEGTCGECLAHPPSFDRFVSPFAYRFPLDRLVRRFKYTADFAIGRYLGDALAAAAAASPRPQLLIAAPSSRGRIRERGFNPALVLARRVASRLRLPLHAGAIAKVRETPAQSGLDRTARLANVRSAFEARRRFDGLDVAVVDDVVTTGATMGALAACVRAAGARSVAAWSVARTPEPPA